MSGIISTLLDIASPKLFAPCLDKWRGNDRFRYVPEVERIVAADPETVSRYHLERIRFLCGYAAKHTRYYRELFKAQGIEAPERITLEEYATLPVITKDIIRERQQDLVSDEFPAGSLRETATGGTTSSPCRFLMDWPSLYRRQAATIVFDRWFGYRPGLRIGYLWGAVQDFPENISFKQKAVEYLAIRSRFYPSSIMDEDRMEQYYRDLMEFRPVLLQCYPTPMGMFAQFLLDRGYTLDVPAVSCSAESLSGAQRQAIEAAVTGSVYEWYGAREIGRGATECSAHDGMHLNEYGLYAEIMEAGFEEGQGELILTDLWTLGMPLLRYAIGDVAELDRSPCACGRTSTRIRRVLGRMADSFINLRGQRLPGVSFTGRIVKNNREYKETQFIQKDYDAFVVRYVPGPEWSPSSDTELTARIDAFTGQQNKVLFERVESVTREASGKLRFCICEVDETRKPDAREE